LLEWNGSRHERSGANSGLWRAQDRQVHQADN
jgi:hypothetical protein